MPLLTHRSRGTGPRTTNMKVVREHPLPNGSRAGALDLQSLARERWRGTGPRPTMRGGVFFTVARGPVPRDGSRTVFFIVARGPVPRDPYRHDVCFHLCSL